MGAFTVQSPICCNHAIKLIWAARSVNYGPDPNSPTSTATKLPVSENPPKHLTTAPICPQWRLPSSPNRLLLVSSKHSRSQSRDEKLRPGVRKKDAIIEGSIPQRRASGNRGPDDQERRRQNRPRVTIRDAQASRIEEWRRGWRVWRQGCCTSGGR
jgi:hypothetical protein